MCCPFFFANKQQHTAALLPSNGVLFILLVAILYRRDTRGYFRFTVLHGPFSGIIINIFPNIIIILLISDHMVIIGSLPDILTVFLIAKPLERSNKLRNFCVSVVLLRRGRPPGLPVDY